MTVKDNAKRNSSGSSRKQHSTMSKAMMIGKAACQGPNESITWFSYCTALSPTSRLWYGRFHKPVLTTDTGMHLKIWEGEALGKWIPTSVAGMDAALIIESSSQYEDRRLKELNLVCQKLARRKD